MELLVLLLVLQQIEDVAPILKKEPRVIETWIVTETRTLEDKDEPCLLQCDTKNDMCLMGAPEGDEQEYAICEETQETCYISCPWDEKKEK
jgi:hypothetical protein